MLEAVQAELCEQRRGLPSGLCARQPRDRSASAALSTALSHGSSRSRWGISTAGAHLIDAAVGRLQSADQLEQGGLAAAARPHDREQLAVGGAHGDVGERVHAGPACDRGSCG